MGASPAYNEVRGEGVKCVKDSIAQPVSLEV